MSALILALSLLVSPTSIGATSATAPADPASLGTGGRTFIPLVLRSPVMPVSASASVLWGVAIQGVPWDMAKLTAWENTVGKKVSVVHFWQFWKQGGVPQRFVPSLLDGIRSHGSIPMITWSPEEMGGGTTQPDFQLADISSGLYDAYIMEWATDAKAWGKPFFLRWGHEADGFWFPWGEDANGNQRGQFVQAWRHVHDLFTSIGATNATWVWCMNVEWNGSPRPSYASLYPGDSYVDWSCLDGYNWGSSYPLNGGWSSFSQQFRYSYDTITQVAPNKPLMLGEWASSETGGSKANWITDALSAQIPKTFPRIKAHIWYNNYVDSVDWRVESSQSSTYAYKSAIGIPYYTTNTYANLSASPIQAPK